MKLLEASGTGLYSIYKTYFKHELSLTQDLAFIKKTSFKQYSVFIRDFDICPNLVTKSSCISSYLHLETAPLNSEEAYFRTLSYLDFGKIATINTKCTNILGNYFTFFKFLRLLVKIAISAFESIESNINQNYLNSVSSNNKDSDSQKPLQTQPIRINLFEKLLYLLENMESSYGFCELEKKTHITHTSKTNYLFNRKIVDPLKIKYKNSISELNMGNSSNLNSERYVETGERVVSSLSQGTEYDQKKVYYMADNIQKINSNSNIRCTSPGIQSVSTLHQSPYIQSNQETERNLIRQSPHLSQSNSKNVFDVNNYDFTQSNPIIEFIYENFSMMLLQVFEAYCSFGSDKYETKLMKSPNFYKLLKDSDLIIDHSVNNYRINEQFFKSRIINMKNTKKETEIVNVNHSNTKQAKISKGKVEGGKTNASEFSHFKLGGRPVIQSSKLKEGKFSNIYDMQSNVTANDNNKDLNSKSAKGSKQDKDSKNRNTKNPNIITSTSNNTNKLREASNEQEDELIKEYQKLSNLKIQNNQIDLVFTSVLKLMALEDPETNDDSNSLPSNKLYCSRMVFHPPKGKLITIKGKQKSINFKAFIKSIVLLSNLLLSELLKQPTNKGSSLPYRENSEDNYELLDIVNFLIQEKILKNNQQLLSKHFEADEKIELLEALKKESEEDVVLLDILSSSLENIYFYYAFSKDSKQAKTRGLMSFNQLLAFAVDFNIFPDILSKSKLLHYFKKKALEIKLDVISKLGIHDVEFIDYSGFIDIIGLIAIELPLDEEPFINRVNTVVEHLSQSKGEEKIYMKSSVKTVPLDVLFKQRIPEYFNRNKDSVSVSGFYDILDS